MRSLGGNHLGAWCALLFAVLCAAAFGVLRLEADERAATEDRLLVARAAEIRAELGDQLSRSVNLARGLRAYVVAEPELEDEAQIHVLLEQIYVQGEHIRNVALAPDDVIRYVHPVEGNEAAIGLRYQDVPEQLPAVELAYETRDTVLAGPVDLVQGGRGLIDRTPVFIRDDSYWGLVSLVLDVDSLVAGVEEAMGGVGVDWAVRTVGNDIQPQTPVTGEAGLFDHADATIRFAVPNGTWELAVQGSVPGPDAVVYDLARVIAVLIAAVISWLVYQSTRARWRARELSLQDDLTGLSNRRSLEERMERALARSRREGVPTGLIYADLDAFKAINDQHGHRAGDQVLRTIADRLRERVREIDTVARIGGDEFVVLMPDTGSAGATRLAAELADLVDEPIPWDDTELRVRASIGTAVHPTDGDSLDALMHHADAAMYEQKRGRQRRV